MEETTSAEVPNTNFRTKFLHYFRNLNLFESECDDEETVRRERFSTRIYLLVLILSMVCLITLAALLPRSVTTTIFQPTEYQFVQLYAKHSDTLECPCTHITQSYGDIVQIGVSFHEVCQSQFISQQYIDVIYAANVTHISPVDIRTTISAFWQLVRSFCDLSKNTFLDVYTTFNGTVLLSTAAESKFLIETKIQTSLKFLLRSAANNLNRNAMIVREIILGNGFMSGLATNYFAYILETEEFGSLAIIDAHVFSDGCSCSNVNSCVRPMAVFDVNQTTETMNIPGFMFSCLPWDAALISTLECFYNTQCLSLVQNHISINHRLDSLKGPSRFLHNVTIQTLIDDLMIEEQNLSVHYSTYYARCNPKSCKYSYTHRFDIPFIITLTTSAFGGISIVLRIIVPILVNVGFMIYAWRIRRNSSIANRQPILQRINIRSLTNSLRTKIERVLVRLNLFKTSSQDTDDIHQQRITTRVFIVCFSLSLLIFGFYILFSTQTKVITVNNPSRMQFESLTKLSSNTLNCPCSHVAISQSKFIEIIPQFHQVCSSQLISPGWYNLLRNITTTATRGLYVFQVTLGYRYFQILALFCSLAQNVFHDAYQSFSAKTWVNVRVLDENVFSVQSNASIASLIMTVRNEFTSILSFIRQSIQTNQLASATKSNFDIAIDSDRSVYMGPNFMSILDPSFPSDYDFVCSCQNLGLKCGYYSTVYDTSNTTVEIPLTNIIVRCLPIESVLSSTLECWFHEQCFAAVRSVYVAQGISQADNISALNVSAPSRFPINATFKQIMDEFLIENWNSHIFYDRYYNTCSPISCVFSIEKRFDELFVAVTLLGVSGGLNRALRLILPILVFILLKILKHIRANSHYSNQVLTNTSVPTIKTSQMHKLRQHIRVYNIFRTRTSTNETAQYEIWSTRLYFILLAICTISLVFYAGSTLQTHRQTILNPSLSTYENLHRNFADALQCPCSNTSIPYRNFIVYLNVTFHPICSSGFITEHWIEYASRYCIYVAWWMIHKDFRSWNILFYKFIQSLCSLANTTVVNAIEDFQSSSFISSEVTSIDRFQTEINIVMKSFQESTSSTFRRPLQTFRSGVSGNALISIGANSWMMKIGDDENYAQLLNIPMMYNDGNCSCATSSSCLEPAAFYNESGFQTYAVEGIVFGCYYLDSVLLSSLSCFFSNSCIQEYIDATTAEELWMVNIIEAFNLSHIVALELLSPGSHFKINDTIETIVNQLFIDLWFNETSYERYYNACAPSSCTYSYTQRLNIIYILSTFLGVYNGIATGLRLIVPNLIKICNKLRLKTQRQRINGPNS